MNLGTSGPSASPPRWYSRRCLPSVLADAVSRAPNYAKNALYTLCLSYMAVCTSAKSRVESRILLVAASQTISSTQMAVWVFFTFVCFVLFVLYLMAALTQRSVILVA